LFHERVFIVINPGRTDHAFGEIPDFMKQPDGWIGNTVKLDVPTVINLRLDPFERTAFFKGKVGSKEYFEWYKFEFW
ncbi:hypothetical protein ACC754_44765, partial [Rhizobium johnstonii]